MLNSILSAIVEVSFSTSFIILLILLFYKGLNKHYSTKWKYLLCLIIALRLLIPVNLKVLEPKLVISPTTFTIEENKAPSSNTMVTVDSPPTTMNSNNTGTLYIKNSGNVNFPSLISKHLKSIYILGLFIFLTTSLTHYISYKRTILRWSLPLKDEGILLIENSLLEELSIKKPIEIRKCKKINTPLVIGIFKPLLLLPCREYSQEHLRIILNHELIHYKRKDILYKLLMYLANAIHWFNPLVYLLVHEANKNLELYCDEEVVKNKDNFFKGIYSETILETMYDNIKGTALLTTHFNGGVNSMKKRFLNIFSTNKKSTGLFSLCAICLTLILSTSLIACSNGNNSSASAEDTAKNFIKVMYEVKNYDSVDEVLALQEKFDSNKEKYYISSNNMTTLTEEGNKEMSELILRDIKSLITENLVNSGTLVANRDYPLVNAWKAKDGSYLTDIELIDLKELSSSKDDEKHFTYSASLKLTYEDGSEKMQTAPGSIYLVKEGGTWLVDYFKSAPMSKAS